MNPITQKELDELAEKCAKATKGKWIHGYSDGSGKYDDDENTFCITRKVGKGKK